MPKQKIKGIETTRSDMSAKQLREKNHHRLLIGSIICAVGALFYCYEFILRIIPGILQNEIRASLGNISASIFGQIAALYYVAYSPMQLPVGILMDRFGPRYLLTLACLCCTLGSFLFAGSLLWVVSMGRLLVGFGSAFAFVGVLSAAIRWLPKQYFSLVAGCMTSLSMFGLIYGEIHITHLARTLGLHTILLLAAGIGLGLVILIALIVRDGPEKPLYHGVPYKKFFKQVFQVLGSPSIWFIGIIGACLYTSLSVFGELWGKSFIELNFNLNKVQSAHTISMLFLGWAVGAPLSGYLSDKSGNRIQPLLWGSLASMICIGLILYDTHLSIVQLNILTFLYGAFSSVEIIVFIMAKEFSPTQALSGTIFAAINMIVSLGGMLLQPLVGVLLDWSSPHTVLHLYSAHDYRFGLSILIATQALVIVMSCIMPRWYANRH